MQKLGQSIVTSKGITNLIAIDMGVLAQVVDTERFKVNLGAGI